MLISTFSDHIDVNEILGVVYASVEGVNEGSYEECLQHLVEKAKALNANGLIGMQLVQSQFQWNQRTSLLATAVKYRGNL